MTAEKEHNLPPVGAKVTRTRTITDNDILRFAEVSGDTNPVHLNEEYATQSRFGRRIAHGFLTGSMISALIGTELPGPGSIYLGQTLKFTVPVYIGDTVTVSVEVTKVLADKSLIFLQTDCMNQDGAKVLTGEATVKYEPGAVAAHRSWAKIE